jgi:hypothetical protein
VHQVLRRAAALSALALSLAATLAAAQRGTAPRVAAINTVLQYRRDWGGDSSRVDACSVFMALGRPDAFPAGIDPELVHLLDRPHDPCAADAERSAARSAHRVVVVDSLVVMDSVVRVNLTVQRGENIHRERYLIHALSTGGWVKEMTTWGVERVHWVRPRRPAQP